MASLVTDTVKHNIQCCVLNMVRSAARKSIQGQLKEDLLNKITIRSYQSQLIQEYIPPGTVLVEGFTSEATLDISSFSLDGIPIVTDITVGGYVVGVIPLQTFAGLDPIQDFVTALVAAINANPSGIGYTAVDNGNYTITVFAPGPGAQANGFVVNVVINPAIQFSVADIEDSLGAPLQIKTQQMCVVNTQTSALYGYHFVSGWISSTGASIIKVYQDGVEVAGSPLTSPFRYVKGIIYSEVNDKVYVIGGQFPDTGVLAAGRVATIEPDLTVTDLPLVTNNGTLDFYNSVYMPSSGAIYTFSSGFGLFKLAFTNVFNLVATDSGINFGDATVGTNALAVDTTNNRIWAGTSTSVFAGNNGIRIYNSDDTLFLSINLGAPGANQAITFYPGDGTPNSERMFVYNPTIFSGDIRSFNADGSVAAASFYTPSQATNNWDTVYYSALFGVLFVGCNGDTDLVDPATGTLIMTLTGIPTTQRFQLVDDVAHGKVYQSTIASILPFSESDIVSYFLGDDGEEQFDQAMEGGTPPVIASDTNNCTSEVNMNKLVEFFKRDCGCIDCEDGQNTSSGSVLPPVATSVIYYGNSADGALDATGIEALGTVSLQTFASTYNFAATAPSEFKYLAWPASLGSATTFTTDISPFPVIMDDVYQVVINFITYNVYRTFNELGSQMQIIVT